MPTTIEDTAMEVVKQYRPLINKIASIYVKPPRITREDLCQEGEIAAYNAVLTFDDTQGASIKTWIYTCVRNAMIAYFQGNVYELKSTSYFQKLDLETIKRQESHLISLDKDFGDELRLSDTIPGPADPRENLIYKEEIDFLLKEIEALNDKEKFILRNSKLFFGELSLEEIGDKLGVTKQCVSQTLKKILNKLKENLQEVI